MKQIKYVEQPTNEQCWETAECLYNWMLDQILKLHDNISGKKPALALMACIATEERAKDLNKILKELAIRYGDLIAD